MPSESLLLQCVQWVESHRLFVVYRRHTALSSAKTSAAALLCKIPLNQSQLCKTPYQTSTVFRMLGNRFFKNLHIFSPCCWAPLSVSVSLPSRRQPATNSSSFSSPRRASQHQAILLGHTLIIKYMQGVLCHLPPLI